MILVSPAETVQFPENYGLDDKVKSLSSLCINCLAAQRNIESTRFDSLKQWLFNFISLFLSVELDLKPFLLVAESWQTTEGPDAEGVPNVLKLRIQVEIVNCFDFFPHADLRLGAWLFNFVLPQEDIEIAVMHESFFHVLSLEQVTSAHIKHIQLILDTALFFKIEAELLDTIVNL